MASNQQFSLRWNNYVQHVTHVFDSLRDEENLVDVTLCCEGRKLRAHKILLSACSGYFREIFKENPCQHPVIIFQNVKYEDLEALVCFMYRGEVNVDQEGLSSFLSTAELLEVKGLIGSGPCVPETLVEDETSKNESKSVKKQSSPKPGSKPDSPSTKKKKVNIDKNSPISERTTSHTELNYIGGGDSEDGYEEAGKWMESDQIKSEDIIDNSYLASDENVDKPTIHPGGTSNDDGNIQESLQGTVDKKLFECKICGLKYKYRSNLSAHKKSHTGETQCRICKRNLSTIQMLQTHLALVHRENFKNIGTDIDHYVCREKYTCYVCEEIFNDSATLTKHHLDLHTSTAFTTKSQTDHPHNCPVCQAKFKYSRNLKEHIKSHTGLTKCLGCDKSLSSRANLRRHLLMLHTRDLQCLICNREFEADRLQIHMCTSHSIGWI